MATLADRPHHDGSERYTEPGPYRIGDEVTVRLRVPDAARADRVRVRSTPDAEPRIVEAAIDAERSAADPGATWWTARLGVENPVVNYRFLLTGGEGDYRWVNEAGVSLHDVTDDADFRLLATPPAPGWLDGTIGYQIFIDRFATSGEQRELPAWAIPQAWDEPIDADPDVSTRQLYGGDFAGIEKHLDHLERLGVNLIYLTPFFAAHSNHRYDASSFEHADPLLGGDAAFASLIEAAHQRGIRVLGDITLNHTGDHHDWFVAGQSDLTGAEADFYMFGDGPDDYESWHGVPSLPKLDHRSGELARRLYEGDDSVVAKYLRAPFGLDGWRVDCANTTGRHDDVDLNDRVASTTLATMRRHRPDGWLLAEHCYDAGRDLRGDGWHGAMAYQWFSRPLWAWLRGDEPVSLMTTLELPRFGGATMVDAMCHLGADVPWASRIASMTMLDSHDSPRFRTAVGGDRHRHLVGVAALLTMPGVPTIFAGSEVGVEGGSMDTCRVPFPWDEGGWDRELFEYVQAMNSLRAEHPALRRGGMRWLDADDDTVTFVRELDDRSVVVHLRRDPAAPPRRIPLITAGVTGSPEVLAGEAAEVVDGELVPDPSAPATVVAVTR